MRIFIGRRRCASSPTLWPADTEAASSAIAWSALAASVV
jgi:hypothetical protein